MSEQPEIYVAVVIIGTEEDMSLVPKILLTKNMKILSEKLVITSHKQASGMIINNLNIGYEWLRNLVLPASFLETENKIYLLYKMFIDYKSFKPKDTAQWVDLQDILTIGDNIEQQRIIKQAIFG